MNKVCIDRGKSPEDTPERILLVIIDDQRREACICENCKNARGGDKEGMGENARDQYKKAHGM